MQNEVLANYGHYDDRESRIRDVNDILALYDSFQADKHILDLAASS